MEDICIELFLNRNKSYGAVRCAFEFNPTTMRKKNCSLFVLSPLKWLPLFAPNGGYPFIPTALWFCVLQKLCPLSALPPKAPSSHLPCRIAPLSFNRAGDTKQSGPIFHVLESPFYNRPNNVHVSRFTFHASRSRSTL